MMEDITIRLFGKDDQALVEDFYNRMGFESRFFFNATGYNYQRTMRYFSENPDEHILHWMAVLDGKMVGYVFARDTDKGIVSLGIAVSDECKGQHLGERLIDTVKQWCRENGKGGILLTTHTANTRAQMLYLRCGFLHMGISNNRGEYLFLYNFDKDAEI